MRQIFAILAGLLTVQMGTAAAEESILIPEPGDVLCVGYEAETHSCVTTTTLRGVSGDMFRFGSITIVSDFSQPLTLVQTGTSQLSGDLYCLVPKTSQLAMDPSTLPGNTLMQMAMMGMIAQLEKKGFCARYRRCGSQYASVSFLGERRAPFLDQLFTHFRADDTDTAKLQTRIMRSTELEKFQGNVAEECLPVT